MGAVYKETVGRIYWPYLVRYIKRYISWGLGKVARLHSIEIYIYLSCPLLKGVEDRLFIDSSPSEGDKSGKLATHSKGSAATLWPLYLSPSSRLKHHSSNNSAVKTLQRALWESSSWNITPNPSWRPDNKLTIAVVLNLQFDLIEDTFDLVFLPEILSQFQGRSPTRGCTKF